MGRSAGRWTGRAGGVLASAVLVVAVPGALGLVPPATAGPDGPVAPAQVRVLQLNLCNSGDADCYTGRSVAEAVAVIRAEAPDVVTLNEVCADDVAGLAAALPGTGRSGPASAFRAVGDRRTVDVVRCRNGQPYGIGVLARRGPVRYGVVGGTYPVQDARSPEQRAWLCLDPVPGAPADPASPRSARPTWPAATRWSPRPSAPTCWGRSSRRSDGHRGAPLVLGGDLNLSWGGVPGARACVPDGDACVGDGVVQHVAATPEFTLGAHRTVGLRETDHPGLLVALVRGAAAPRQ